MSKICPECGKSFNGSTGQKYCSYRCCKRHNRKAKEIKHPDPPKGVSIIRAFPCKECGHEVLVWERTDKEDRLLLQSLREEILEAQHLQE